MSSAGRGGKRLRDDFYITPMWVVYRLLDVIDLPEGEWLECCAGDGNIIKAVNQMREGITWFAVERRDDCRDALVSIISKNNVSICDYLEVTIEKKFDVVITNPPYSLAMEVIKKSFLLSDWVVMLLRLNFIGSVSRVGFMQKYTPDVYVLPNRPSFYKGGTDSTEYAWFIWSPYRRRDVGEIQVLPVTSSSELRWYR
jgi:hypothetical protein